MTTERNAEPVYSDRVFTVPNVLSVLRLIGVPVFLWLLLVEKADGWAFALLVASGITDWLDGKLARLLDQSSRLGALLDPLVDRLYLLATLGGFLIRGILPWWVVLILIARDGILTLTLGIYRRRGLPRRRSSTWARPPLSPSCPLCPGCWPGRWIGPPRVSAGPSVGHS